MQMAIIVILIRLFGTTNYSTHQGVEELNRRGRSYIKGGINHRKTRSKSYDRNEIYIMIYAAQC